MVGDWVDDVSRLLNTGADVYGQVTNRPTIQQLPNWSTSGPYATPPMFPEGYYQQPVSSSSSNLTPLLLLAGLFLLMKR